MLEYTTSRFKNTFGDQSERRGAGAVGRVGGGGGWVSAGGGGVSDGGVFEFSCLPLSNVIISL